MTRAWRTVGSIVGTLALVAAAGAARSAPAPSPAVAPFSGPAMCAVLGRLGPLAGQGFSPIDLGPDRSASDPKYHRSSLSMEGGANCFVDHEPGKPNTYTCIWPVSPKAEDQFVALVQSLRTCVGGTLDMKMLEDYGDPDVTLRSHGVEYRAVMISSFVSLDVRPAAAAPTPSKPATAAPKSAAPGASAAAPAPAGPPQRRPPDWWAVGRSTAGDVTFVDVATLAQRGPTAMAITYTVFKTPEGAVKSYLARELFYCSASRERRLNTTLFDPAGKPVTIAGVDAPAPVEEVRPGSYRGQVLAFACGPASARGSAVQIGALGLSALNDAATIISR